MKFLAVILSVLFISCVASFVAHAEERPMPTPVLTLPEEEPAAQAEVAKPETVAATEEATAPAASPTATPAITPTPSPTPEATVTPTPSVSPSPTATPADASLETAKAETAPTPASMNLSLEQTTGLKLTLEESIRMAVLGASAVLKAENDQRYSGTHLLQAYGQFLPNLVGAGSYNYMTGKTYTTVANPTFIDGAGRNASATIQADLNLFNGLSDFSNLKSSILKKDAADLTVTRAKQQISLDVAQAFLQVVLDRKLVEIAEKNLKASQERERLLQEQTDVGARNLSDLFRQQAQTSLDESSFLAAQNRVRTDQIALMRKLRVDVNKTYQFVEPSLPEERSKSSLPNEDELVASALNKRADLKASTDRSDAGSWDVHTALGNYMPKLDLIGSISSVGHTLDRQTVNGVDVMPPNQFTLTNQLGKQVEYVIGITLTWSLFDRFVTAQNVSQARVIADNAEIDAVDRKYQVQGEVRQAYGDYLTSLQQLRASKKGLEAAQKAYEVMDGRYGVGAASFLDLITAQSVLAQAEAARAQAVINFQLQDRSLSFAVGDLAVSAD